MQQTAKNHLQKLQFNVKVNKIISWRRPIQTTDTTAYILKQNRRFDFLCFARYYEKKIKINAKLISAKFEKRMAIKAKISR